MFEDGTPVRGRKLHDAMRGHVGTVTRGQGLELGLELGLGLGLGLGTYSR